jgi:hypothetical protein
MILQLNPDDSRQATTAQLDEYLQIERPESYSDFNKASEARL